MNPDEGTANPIESKSFEPHKSEAPFDKSSIAPKLRPANNDPNDVTQPLRDDGTVCCFSN